MRKHKQNQKKRYLKVNDVSSYTLFVKILLIRLSIRKRIPGEDKQESFQTSPAQHDRYNLRSDN